MKIDRLIGILSILLQQDKITAPQLAEKFEVSRRTINRDVEDLCKAGIPIVTAQGVNGGISIMDGYKLNRTLLTSSDMQSIIIGLRSLDSVAGTNRYQQLMDKLKVNTGSTLSSNEHIVIDLSSYYKESLAPKIEYIQDAIERQRYIRFAYYGPRGEGDRKIEPYLLVFQWSSWYVWGYCMKRKDYRMFKLNRMQELEVLEECFEKRDIPPFDITPEGPFVREIPVKALVDAHMKWRLIEEYGLDSFSEQEDGKLLFQFEFNDEDNLFSWLFSFGNSIELLEPLKYREKAALMAQRILDKYAKNK